MQTRDNINLWAECQTILRDILPAEQYDTWFAPLSIKSYENGSLTLAVPSSFFVEQLEERFYRQLTSTLIRVFGELKELNYYFEQVRNEPDTGVTMRSENPSTEPELHRGTPAKSPELPPINPRLNPRYNFENFCEGDANKVARAIGEAIAGNPELKTFNPFFIFGSTGVGKTHLMHSIGIRILERFPLTRVLYVTARMFQSQFITEMQADRLDKFIQFYQSVDVLLLDDIQDLIGKPGTQNTFFHIFNHLHQNGKQLILSSDCRPSELGGMEERLLSRFKWGMTVELEKPDPALRRRVLEHKSQQDGLNIAPEILDYISANVTESIRELDGIISSLVGHAAILNKPITLDLAKRVVANAVKINRRQINFEMITEHVSSYFNIKPDEIFTKSRKREVSDARQMIMYLAKKHAHLPYKNIGARLSRTHATVLYACRNIEDRLSVEEELRATISAIEKALNP